MQGNTWRRSPVLVNERPHLTPGKFGSIPHDLLKTHKILSAPAYRMLLFFASNGTGFYLSGRIVSEYTGIKVNKISFYRNELCEKGFVLYADDSITVNWQAIIEETEDITADEEIQSVAPKSTGAAPARGIDIPPPGAYNKEYKEYNKEASSRRKTAIRMAKKRKNDRINALTDSDLRIAFRLDDNAFVKGDDENDAQNSIQ